jgi:hypothetical protein
MLSLLFLSLLAIYLLRPLLRLLYAQHLSPLHLLPGPPSPNFLMGHLKEMHDMENTSLLERWEGTYGRRWVYKGFFGGCRLVLLLLYSASRPDKIPRSLITTDLHSISHVLSRAYQYPKPQFVKDAFAAIGGGHQGLLSVEGDVHRRQRRILVCGFLCLPVSALSCLLLLPYTQSGN